MNNALATQSAPYSQEAEEAVLGALMVNPDAFTVVSTIIKPEDFFFVRHGYVFQAMVNMQARNQPIDYLVLMEELKPGDKLAEIGGPSYLTYLVNNTPTSIYAEVYAHMVRRAADRRRLMIAVDEIKALALNEEITIADVERQARDKLASLEFDSDAQAHVIMRAAIDEQRLRMAAQQDNPMIGIPTGVNDLDVMFGGFRRKRVYGVLARTHIGKTSFMLSCALHAGHTLSVFKLAVVVVSVEEDLDDLTDRLVSLEAGIPKDSISRGELTPEQDALYIDASNQISELNIILVPVLSLTPADLEAELTRIKAQYNVGLVFVDYIQAMSAGAMDKLGEYQRLAHISNELPRIAKAFNVPIVYGIQAKREVEERDDKRPHLKDSEGCGKIEQRVDVMFGLYRDLLYNEDTLTPDMMEIEVMKNKIVVASSGKGKVKAYSDPITGRVTQGNLKHIELNDDPPANVKRAEFKGNPYAGQQPTSKRGMAIGGLRDGTGDREDE